VLKKIAANFLDEVK